jgi:hypothetical protein
MKHSRKRNRRSGTTPAGASTRQNPAEGDVPDDERLERLHRSLMRVLSSSGDLPADDVETALDFCDPLAQRVARMAARDPLFGTHLAAGRAPRGISPPSLTREEYRAHGLIAGERSAHECDSFASRLPPITALGVVGGSRPGLTITELRAPWRTPGKVIPTQPFVISVRGGWSTLAEAGVISEVVLILLSGTLEVECGSRRELLEARSSGGRAADGERRSGRVACLSLWSKARERCALPSIHLRSASSIPARGILVVAAQSGVTVSALGGAPCLARSARRAETEVRVCTSDSIEMGCLDAPIFGDAVPWARELPLYSNPHYAHQASIDAGEFSIHDPLGQVHGRSRQLHLRVLLLRGGAGARSAHLARHSNKEELLIPIHGQLWCRYSPSHFLEGENNAVRLCELEESHPSLVPAAILTSPPADSGWLDPTVIAIDSEDLHTFSAPAEDEVVCLQVLRQRRPAVSVSSRTAAAQGSQSAEGTDP